MTNSKQKGNRFERLVASLFRSAGYAFARRGQQFSGLQGDADVVGVPGIHIECKHHERGHGLLYDWIAQAKRDAKGKKLPVVIHKKNNCNVLVTMEWDDWIKLYREWECSMNDGNDKVEKPKHLIEKKQLIRDVEQHKKEWGSFVDGHSMAQEIIYIIEDAEEWG